MKKFLKWVAITLGGLIGLVFLAGAALYPSGVEKLTRSYPGIFVEKVDIPTGPGAVARGRHIAIVWKCSQCHGEDLSGKLLFNDPVLGTITASNLTSGEGGIAGSYNDSDWIRAIRHGVKPNSRVEVFMYDYSTMSDQDLGDLIAYLKQIPPVDAVYPEMRFGPVIPIAPAVGLFPPAAEQIDHRSPRTAAPAPSVTIEYGKYLYALCAECHRGNLSSRLKQWKQDDFIRAMRAGVFPDGRKMNAEMTSKNFSELDDTELSALWLYLQSLAPVKDQK